MADRYQNRSYPAGGDYDRDAGSRTSADAESDPLAELARLIGQTDPFGSRPISRANLPVQPQARPLDREPSYDNYARIPNPRKSRPPGPPSWMQRAVRQEAPPPPPQDDYPAQMIIRRRPSAAPLCGAHPPAEPEYDPEPSFADSAHEPDLSRYDEALYGGFDSAHSTPSTIRPTRTIPTATKRIGYERRPRTAAPPRRHDHRRLPCWPWPCSG